MIHEGKKLPDDAMERVSRVITLVSDDQDVLALYLFGSGAQNRLQPLSDLDFGILLLRQLDKKQRFEKQIDLIGKFNDFFGTDEIDLVVLNDAPSRFSFNILKYGTLLFFRNKKAIIDFREQVSNYYLDFKYFRADFDRVFVEGIGCHG
ncbi:MAG: nucleotidyltransferase domain-containing protein [Thermodesulfobacteriota bacterium]|nr:nucleotidyltransferase domain-containing protein [Thermodesulfobacteriota bacterium]